MDRTTDERLNHLERECRQWKRAVVGLGAFGAITLLAGGGVPGFLQADRLSVGNLEAQRIVLKDERGRLWFVLENRGGVPQMSIREPVEDGKRGSGGVLLYLNQDGVRYMSLSGKDGGLLAFGVGPAGKPHLTLSGKGGMTTLGMADDGSPRVMLWDGEGWGRVRVRLKPDGSGAVEVLDKKDAPRSPEKLQADQLRVRPAP